MSIEDRYPLSGMGGRSVPHYTVAVPVNVALAAWLQHNGLQIRRVSEVEGMDLNDTGVCLCDARTGKRSAAHPMTLRSDVMKQYVMAHVETWFCHIMQGLANQYYGEAGVKWGKTALENVNDLDVAKESISRFVELMLAEA